MSENPKDLSGASRGLRRLLTVAAVGFVCLGLLAASWTLAKYIYAGLLNTHQRARLTDLGQIQTFRAANQALPPDSNRIVFLGDSITRMWDLGASFGDEDYLNRGIDAQTSGDMLVRFRQDVINLNPRVVVILAGFNDLYEGYSADRLGKEHILSDLESNDQTMAELAELHGIQPVFISVLPVHTHAPRSRRMGLAPIVEMITSANVRLKKFCTAHHYQYIDLYLSMVDQQGMMRSELSEDGVHPNRAGYQVMTRKVAEALEAIQQGAS